MKSIILRKFLRDRCYHHAILDRFVGKAIWTSILTVFVVIFILELILIEIWIINLIVIKQ